MSSSPLYPPRYNGDLMTIRPQTGDPHFPVLCDDLPGAMEQCCYECHLLDGRDDSEGTSHPYELVQNDKGEVVSRINFGDYEALGYACCEMTARVRSAILGLLAEHVLDTLDGCKFCELEAMRQ